MVVSEVYVHEERTRRVAWVVRYHVSPHLLAKGDERAARVQKYDLHRRSDLWPAFQLYRLMEEEAVLVGSL